jgi:sulfite reductase (NADPH) flavoprotein alpha-component
LLKKTLFQLHRLIGISAGIVLAFNGITGALMAFGPQLRAHYGPTAQRVAPTGSSPLAVEELYHRVQAVMAGRAIASLMVFADPTVPDRVQLQRRAPGPAVAANPMPGPGDNPDMPLLINPYTGAAMPSSTPVSRFLDTVERLHRAQWAGDGAIGHAVHRSLSWIVLLLFYMTLSGLYLRWPRGRARRDWRVWFKLNFKLRGAAFLWNLHSVLGTCVLLVYLMSAHTGLMIAQQLNWYRAGSLHLGAALGMPGPPPQRGEAPAPAASQSLPLAQLWQDFSLREPAYGSATIEFPRGAGQPIGVVSNGRRYEFDADSGALRHVEREPSFDPIVDEPLVAAFINGNPGLHTGQRWGIPGQLLLMCTSLVMPVMLISGWMMYLGRWRRTAKARASTHSRSVAKKSNSEKSRLN